MISDNFYRYTLTTPWNINTIVGDSADQTRRSPFYTFNAVSNSMFNNEAITFSPDGKYLIALSRQRKRVWRWDKQ